MIVAITGVSGYLGGLLLARLDQTPEGEAIVGISRRRPIRDSKKLSFHSMDINGPIGKVLAEQRVDTVVHAAWQFDPVHDEKAAYKVNIHGTRNVLQACDELAIGKIIFPSSLSVYGPYDDNPDLLTEDSPTRGHPDFQYSRDKVEGDALMQQYQASHPDCCVSIPRIAIVAGPNANNYLARYVSRSVVFTVRGGDAAFQFVHEDDTIDVLMKMLLEDQPGVYNIAGDGTIRLSELGRLFGTHLIPLPYSMLYPVTARFWALHIKAMTETPPSVLDFLRYSYIADCSKAKRELDLRPKYTSTQALQSYVEARRRNGGEQRPG